MINLVWFRQDLRIIDHSALFQACQNKDAKVIAVFVATPELWHNQGRGANYHSFLYHHLHQLAIALTSLNISLFFFQEKANNPIESIFETLIKRYNVTNVYYHKLYDKDSKKQERLINEKFSATIQITAIDEKTLFPPGRLVNKQGEMFKVFTPFKNRFLYEFDANMICPTPKPVARINNIKSESSNKLPDLTDYPLAKHEVFPIGEENALARLDEFCQHKIGAYSATRDFPYLDGTSQLSAYLSLGILSVRQCIAAMSENEQGKQIGAAIWLNELIWREFYLHIFALVPAENQGKPVHSWANHIAWDNDKNYLKAWQKGETGFPLIDAAMKQLNQTGWMHNRLRMLVASFLTKDLLLDWRLGERYFMSQLYDGEIAANNGGWQWAASTGFDAVPYFRIFNPVVQSQKFDPDGEFIAHYLPELAIVPPSQRHSPHQWARKEGIILNYPQPIIDHKLQRQKALALYKSAKLYNSMHNVQENYS